MKLSNGSVLALRISLRNEADLWAVLDALEDVPSPPDVVVKPEDASALGAFDTEWIINLVLSFHLGVVGNLVATWVSDRLKAAKDTVAVVFPDGTRVEVTGDADRERLTTLLSARVPPGSPASDVPDAGEIRS